MTNTCLKTSAHDLWQEDAVKRAELRLLCGGEQVHPGYYTEDNPVQELQVLSRRMGKTKLPLRAAALAALFSGTLVTVVGVCSMPSSPPVSAPKQRVVFEMPPAPAPAPIVLPAQTTTPELEDRFQKISAVLEFLMKQRQAPAPLPVPQAEPEAPPVATVVVDKAYLRSGPGKQHSPVMAVARGTRLVVERQEGEWLRVVGPTGESVWVSRTVLLTQSFSN